MGCAVQFHIKPSQQKTFGENSEDGFYLKTSAEHYRTHIIFCKKTQAKQLADTVFSSTNISRNPRSHQRTPLSMHSQNCGTPSTESNTQKMMPTSKLSNDSNTLFSLPTNMQSKRSNMLNFQGWNNKSNLPSKFQGCALTMHHPRSMTLCLN
jgi:hypothetical protein